MKGIGRLIANLFLLAIIIVIGLGLYFSHFGKVIPGQWLAAKKTAGIFVTGSGEEMTSPDVAKVQLGSSEMAAEVSASFEGANKIVDKIKAALSKVGIEDKDIQTSRYTIYPEYNWVNDEQILKGYRTEHILTITVRDTSKVNDVVSESVDAGANRIEDISFTVDDPSKLGATAREKAVVNAKQKAEAIASSFGASLGQVISVEETAGGDNTPIYTKMAPEGGGGMGAGSSISPGQLSVRVSVTVNYALKY